VRKEKKVKKILIVDESSLFRDYLAKKLESSFEVVQGSSGLDAIVKMRNEVPDLVIMEYYLSRKSCMEVLQEKKEDPNTAPIPVIIVSGKLDADAIKELAQHGIKKIFTKPIKLDVLLNTVGEIFNVSVDIDETPCIIEAHFNDEIMFLEIAQGLNTEKIELLKYKISELLQLYDVKAPRVLIMLSSIELTEKDSKKLELLLMTVLETGRTKGKFIKILTNSPFVREFVTSRPEFSDIGVTDNLNSAMDDLLGLKPDSYAHDEVVQDKLLRTTTPRNGGEQKESFQLRFEDEKKVSPMEKLESIGSRQVSIAIVDDDLVIRELVKTIFSETDWETVVYENGKEFVADTGKRKFDLVFLDLMMPEMNGFQVLQYLREKKIEFPIIVFSALSHKERVVKAVVGCGVHSYLIKPLKPEQVMQKAVEILGRNF